MSSPRADRSTGSASGPVPAGAASGGPSAGRAVRAVRAVRAARAIGAVRALLLSCHPVPTVAVTLVAAGLGILAGLTSGRLLLVVAAVLAGQLAIGWSNDALDAGRDRAAGRTDKPVALGDVPARLVGWAAVVATLACVALSAVLGVAAGAASLVVLVCGLGYDLGLKATAWSAVPYAVAFGSLPAVATLARPDPVLPAWWAVVAGALFGVSAHLANVLPDLADDVATGVRGLPHRLGPRVTAVGAPVVLLLSSLAVLVGSAPTSGSGGWRWPIGVLLVLVAAAGAVAGWRRPAGRGLFLAVIGVVLADLVLFAVSGQQLT